MPQNGVTCNLLRTAGATKRTALSLPVAEAMIYTLTATLLSPAAIAVAILTISVDQQVLCVYSPTPNSFSVDSRAYEAPPMPLR